MDHNLELQLEEIRRRQELQLEENRQRQEAILAAQSELRAAIQSEVKAAIQSEVKAAIQSEVKAAIRSEFTRRFGQQIVDAPKDLDLDLERPPSPSPSPLESPLFSMEFEEEDPVLSMELKELSIKFGMIKETRLRHETYLVDGISFSPLRYDIYMVDKDGYPGREVNEYTGISPRAQFDFRPVGLTPTVCLVKSTVYVFEGSNYQAKHYPLLEATHPKQKAAYKFGFGDHQLTCITPMNHLKTFPNSLLTPDGDKILVFSNNFIVKDSHRAFELLNIKGESWSEVPPLHCLDDFCTKSESLDAPWWVCRSSFVAEVMAYSFIGDSHFLIQMCFRVFALDLKEMKMCFGVFVLDLKEMKWTRLRVGKVVPDDHRGYFDIIEGRYLLIPRPRRYNGGPRALWTCDLGEDGFLAEVAVDINDFKFAQFGGGKNEHWCPLSAFPRDGTLASEFYVLPLRQHHGVCINLVVQVYFESSPKVSILANICCTNLATINTSVYKVAGLAFSFPKAEWPSEIKLFNI